MNLKYPGGIATQSKLLRAEGHEIISGKGKKSPTVKNFEKVIAPI